MRSIILIISAFLFLAVTCVRIDEVEPEPTEYGCEQSECWDADYYLCRDNHYNDFFTRAHDWTGGDATYSVELSNNRRLWMFGDTFIDQVNSDGTRPSFRLINNSLVIEEGDLFTTYYEGTRDNPVSFAEPPEENWWYWPADGTLAGDTLYLFMHGFGNDAGGMWDFYRTSVDLLKLNPESLEVYENLRLFETPDISWGAAILEEENYTYIYGVRPQDFTKKAFVARTNATLTDVWEYYIGTGWSLDVTKAAPVFSNVSEQFSVFERDGSYYLLNQQNFLGFEIHLSTMNSPTDTPTGYSVVYCTPEAVGDLFTYNALAHPDVYSDSLLISYNINSFNFIDLLKDVNNYRPYFVRVGSWQKP